MKQMLAALLLTLSMPAMADHYDVIELKLKDGCSLATYMQVVKDFNEWGKGYGYRAEVANKVQHPDLTTLLWLGRSANARRSARPGTPGATRWRIPARRRRGSMRASQHAAPTLAVAVTTCTDQGTYT